MTCPMHKGKTKEDALCLANKMKKITVADTISGIKDFMPDSQPTDSNDIDENAKAELVRLSMMVVMILVMRKEKQQTTYEMDYEDDSGGEQLESEIDMSKDEKVVTENNMIRSDDMCESSRSSPNLKNISMPMSREKNTR
ncbi:hypothetical protein PVK06_032602 [Gossypium arboreum]|uniref:Uncharacterized protein n=1 Tax=Gossypium arboreum TaxID=29729 RepID=A0ABR0NUE9_GOSAR|nr:hypothetical protein PVK06_032602 [Gossypium arboreum]